MSLSKKNIQLFGAARCHKTQHYIDFFNKRNIDFTFLDVEVNEAFAESLRNLYENRKLNFPTIMIEDTKLRNPRDNYLEKWLKKKGILA
jgi:arsenate reductase-like glutaredoxin family protein